MSIHIGAARIHRVEEKRSEAPAEMFHIDRELLKREHAWIQPAYYDDARNALLLSVHSWVVQVDGLNVLIDPCIGNHKVRLGRPWAHQLDSPYLERLAAAGFTPEDIDVVVCTHLHADHCGWNTRLQDGRWIPTFPRARYLLGRRELDRWIAPATPGSLADVIADSVAPVIQAGLAHLVDDHHEVSASLRIEPAHGHTLGHSMVHLSSQEREGLFVGDALMHPIEIVYPHTGLGGFEDATLGLATRLRILNAAAERRALLLPAHFVEPHAGWVVRRGAGFAFEPLNA